MNDVDENMFADRPALTLGYLYDLCWSKGVCPTEVELIFTDFAHEKNVIDGEPPLFELVENAQLWSVNGNRQVPHVLLLKKNEKVDES